MTTTEPSLHESLRRWQDAAQTLPRIAVGALRHGVLPAGLSAAVTLRREGLSDLHWKILGDGLCRFLRHSGPLFAKFGQILATRDDLLPGAVGARLETLYDQQPPMSPRQLEAALRAAYGRKSPFRRFTRKPLAVGTIGQVHRARLRSGEAVIVKIIRPGVERQIARDLEVARVLLRLPSTLPGRNDGASLVLLTRSLEDLAEGFRQEVDLCGEAVSLERFRARFSRNPRVVVPRVHAEFSSAQVLVMDELRGKPLSVWRKRAATHPREAKKLADLALTEILKQIFEDGHFHADPHAGNLLVLDDGRLGLIDLGLTGEFSGQDRRNIVRAVRAFLASDMDGVISALLAFGDPPADLDSERFTEDIRSVIASHQETVTTRIRGRKRGSPRGASNPLDDFVSALFAVAHAHRVYVPSSATLLIKTLVTIEGVARSLDPDLNLTTTALPVVLRALTPPWLRWAFGARAAPADR